MTKEFMTLDKLMNGEGHNNNFTPLRMICALAVLYGHSWGISLGWALGTDPITYYLRPLYGESLPSLAVEIFFVISGFLVCASYSRRNNLIIFIRARFFRIYPGLIMAVVFCIFLGASVTTLSLNEYFQSQVLWDYFKFNSILINGLNFGLPGVFASNPYPNVVNGSLWSLPYEIWLYISLAILGALQIINSRATFNLFFLTISLIYLVQAPENFLFLKERGHVDLALFFIFGSFFYVNREFIDISFKSLLFLVGIYYCLQFIFLAHEIHFFRVMKFILVSYSVILIAYHPSLRLPFSGLLGDISYGIYDLLPQTGQLSTRKIDGVDLLPQTGQLSTRKIDGVVELQKDLANIAGGRSPSDECGLKQL